MRVFNFWGFSWGLPMWFLDNNSAIRLMPSTSHKGTGIFALTLSVSSDIGFLSKAKERCQDLQGLEMVPPLVWKDCPLLWSLQYCVGNPFRSCRDVMEDRLSFSNHYDETLSWLRRSENTTPPETFQMNPIQLLFRGLESHGQLFSGSILDLAGTRLLKLSNKAVDY
ncbi:hypothetical protein Peur_048203 [Populus x canadensis]